MTIRHGAFDDLLDALEDDDGYYFRCSNGHGALPPRRVCPTCGDDDLVSEPLPPTGTVDTYTEIHVASPEFADETPYVVAIADFDPVRLTGYVRGEDVEIGARVTAAVDETKSGERFIAFDLEDE